VDFQVKPRDLPIDSFMDLVVQVIWTAEAGDFPSQLVALRGKLADVTMVSASSRAPPVCSRLFRRHYVLFWSCCTGTQPHSPTIAVTPSAISGVLAANGTSTETGDD
jgi:hypothetical protein